MFDTQHFCNMLYTMNNWLLLILSLPTENTAVRMRAWRAVKSAGAAVLRDGVYLLPDLDRSRELFQRIAEDVKEAGGSVFLMNVGDSGEQNLPALFDRSQDYAQLAAEIATCHHLLANSTSPTDVIKPIRKLRKTLSSLIEIDFFPSIQQSDTTAALTELEAIVEKLLSPDEPQAVEGIIPKQQRSAFQKQRWATRQRPWMDRLASAWLIRRHIDPDAHFIWLASIADCPQDAIGFDFDGARFSHVGDKVTFETLLVSFDLESPALSRVGRLVHCLDVGGIRPAEASGVEQVLAGLSASIADDDHFLEVACGVFDGLYAAFDKEQNLQEHKPNPPL